MFDSVLGRGSQPPRVLIRGALVSILVHVAVLGLAIFISVRAHQAIKKQATEVKFVAPPPPPPPPPVATAVQRTEKRQQAKKEFVKKENTIVDSKEAPKEDNNAKGGGEGGDTKPSSCGGPGQPVCCGGPGDPPCRHCGGAGEPACCGGPGEPACAPVKAPVCGDPGQPPCGNSTIPFGQGMVRPSLLAGEEQPALSREALVAKVEGLVIAKCTITTEGAVKDCKLIKTLPYMDEAIKANLMARKYTPVMFQGKPVSVEYTFTFRIVQK